MASSRTVNRSFAGGELGPDMYGRIDDQKYQSGAALVRNFITLPQGPAQNRPGFEYVNSTKNNGIARLIPFIYNIDQTTIIELGDQYARFHTDAETVLYDSSTLRAWQGPAGATTYTLATPTVIYWFGHALLSGDPVRFYATSSDPLPIGLQVGYTYIADVIDVSNFYIKDPATGLRVGLSAPPGGTVTYTNYPGAGTTSTSVSLAPNQVGSHTSGAVGGLANVPISGGSAFVNASFSVQGYSYQGPFQAELQYSLDGTNWHTLYTLNTQTVVNVRVSIALTNLDLLSLRTYISATTGPSGSVSLTAAINSWSVDVPSGGSSGATATIICYRYYTAGDAVTYGGSAWQSVKADSGGITTPGTNPDIWALLPANAVYEIPTPYAAADVFDIHYVQSADVITLVHPNYPPAELKRLAATTWTLTNVVFQPSILPPTSVTTAASPGFKVKIQSISGTLITTQTNHTLSLGDQIYIDSLVANTGGDKSGFYLVSEVPVNTSTGALILNELRVMDYNGVQLDVTSWGGYTGSPTIQLATKSYDPTSHYVVTAIASDGVDESQISSDVSVLNNLDVPGSFNTISWSAVATALRYNIYKMRNGLYGYIGETPNLSFVDDNIGPDFSITPPNYEVMFSGPGNYPAAVGYAEQRKCYAGTDNQPQNLWMSNSGTEDTFSYSLPIKDTDRIAIAIASREANIIRHIVPMTELMLLTSSAEIVIKPANSDVITPGTISAKPQTYVGANNVQPSVINTALVYCAARGGHVRELGYAWTVNGFTTGDLSLRAAHLFDNLTLVDMCYQKAPRPILWFVSSGGNLLGLTYVPEEQIGAWHHHDTQGVFESVACVAEGGEDRLYAVIRRRINGTTVRYVERMASRILSGTNQLQNPNFEEGTAGWIFQSDLVNGGSWQLGSAGPLYVAIWNGAGTAAVINRQHIACSSGTEIEASCRALGEPGATGDAVLRINFFDASDAIIQNFASSPCPNNYNWTTLSLLSTAPAGTAYAMIDFAVLSATMAPGGPRWSATNFVGGYAPTQQNSFFVDAGATYSGAPATTVSGLTWLEGQTVSVLADGAVYQNKVVSGGAITLEQPASLVTVGLPYTSDLVTLPPVLQVDGFGQGRMLNINRVWMKIFESSQILIGPDEDHLTPYKQRTTEPWGTPPALITGQIGPIVVTPEWGAGTVFIRQQDPLPLTVLGLTIELSIGG
jgi:hypothetical protein